METKFKTLSVMLDASRNGVPKLEFLKSFIAQLGALGYNQLQLYTEDTYEIESEPYFGHLRGRYTAAEIIQIDAWCKEQNIELVPCIQTLAHLAAMFKQPHYRHMNDIKDILLVDYEPTYELIDKMFAACAKSFSSRKINIGMDEADMLGLGRYLSKNGYKQRYGIMCAHLKRVKQIADKYGFKLMMWSDMFFRIANDGDYFLDEGKDIVFSPELKKDIPQDVDLIYWDYALRTPEGHKKMFQKHAEITDSVIFAGGATKWMGLAPYNEFSIAANNEAFKACGQSRVDQVIATMWADDSSECPIISVLPTLAHYAMYNSTGKTDMNSLRLYFRQKLGLELDDFMLLDKINELWSDKKIGDVCNPSKYMLYNDPLLGMLDYYEKDVYCKTFKKVKNELLAAAKRNKQHKYVFDYLAALSGFLQLKCGLGTRLTEAYKAKKPLDGFIKEIAAVQEALDAFIGAYGKYQQTEYKAFGREVMDMRLGGLKARYKLLMKKVKAYSAGKLCCIEEFEQPRLPYDTENQKFYVHFWASIATPGAGLYALM